MSFFGSLYNKAKKKIKDWEGSASQSVSSGFGSMYNQAKNSLNGVENNVSRYVAPKIQSFENDYVKPVSNFTENKVIKPAIDSWKKSMFNPQSEISKAGAERRNKLPLITRTEARSQLDFKSQNSTNDAPLSDMPVVKSFQQKSFKPLTDQFATPEGRRRSVENMGKIDPMNAIGMGEAQAVGKMVGRVVNKAIQKSAGSGVIQKIIKTGEKEFAPVVKKTARNVAGRVLPLMGDASDTTKRFIKTKVGYDNNLNTRIAQKRALATEKVNRQITNQKAGLDTAEPGFVAPQAVVAPRPKDSLPTIDEFVNGKVAETKQINKYHSNAYKVYSGQKPDRVVAQLPGEVAKKTNLPNEVVVKKAFFEKMATNHPEIDKNKLFSFVKTLNIPDDVYHLPQQEKLNFFRNLENKAVNIVSTGKDISLPQSNVVTSFNVNPTNNSRIKYLDKIKNTSEKVFPTNSGGTRQSPSSNILSEVPGTGASKSPGLRNSTSNTSTKSEIFQGDGKTNDVPFKGGIPFEKEFPYKKVISDEEFYKNEAFFDKLKMPSIEEFVNGKKPDTPKDVLQSGPYNRFQQKAFDKKADRVEALRDVLSYPTELAKIGYKKAEIDKIGQEQASRILKLADLGFPKNAMPRDLLSDQVSRIIKKNVSWSQLKDYYERKNALNTNFLDGVDPRTLQDINPLMVGGRDVYRNFEAAFGSNYPKIKTQLLDPFDAAKGNLFKEQEALANEVFESVVKKLGIQKGSDLDKAVVQFGEGKISMEKLQELFPNDWQKVVDADQWFRNKYPELLSDLNAVREANFPTHPLYPETSKIIPQRKDYYRHGKDLEGFAGLKNMFESSANIDPALAATSDVTNPKTKWLSFAQKRKSDENDFGAVEGYLDYIKNHSYAKHVDPFIQKFKGVDDEAKDMLPRGAFSEDNARRGLAEELAQKMDPVQQITESSDAAKIKQILMDKDVSEPQAEWMSKELANITNYEKTVAFLKNKLKKNTGKQIENLTTPVAPAEQSQNKENNFLTFLKNFSRDLAGKTNPMDRGFQENVFGRKALSIANWANSRFKANAVLGNASSSLAQFFNIPQGFASAGARNSAKGLGQSLAGIFKENGPIKQSAFVRERYFNGFNKFDTGILDNTKKFAVWMTGIGDKIGTNFIWNSHYQKALSEGVANPVKYADDWTRKMVAGRGIGEVPIIQKSKIFQLAAPFQLEVANQWYALRDMAKNDPRKLVVAKKMLEFSVASYLMNQVVKEIRGSDVSFDPINAMTEAYGEYQKEDDKLKGIMKAGGRVAGEVVSNLPLGQSIAGIYPEFGFGIDKDNFPTAAKVLNIPRKDFFGEGDPTRFGTGGLPFFSAIKNPLTGFVTPYGGKQLEKTYSGAKALMQGFAENNSGKIMTPVSPDATNVMKGLLFGKNAFNEVQDYFDNNGTPLSDLQTEKYKLMGNDPAYFNKIIAERKTNQEKAALKSGKPIENMDSLSDGMTQLSNGSVYVKSLDREFKTAKEANMAVAMDDLSNSEENFRDLKNGWVLRKGEDGNVIKQRRDSYDSGLNTAKLTGYKKNEDLVNWKKTAETQINLLGKMMIDPSIDDYEKAKIQNAIDTLVGEYQKYGSYGGFKKGRKAAKLEEKYRYPLVDPEFMKISMLIAGGGKKKPIIAKRAISLIKRRLPRVRRTRKR